MINKAKLRYTDHYAIMCTFKNIPRKPEKSIAKRRTIIWNTNKKGSWEKYYSKTNINKVLYDAVSKQINDANSLAKIIEKELESIKYACFGKVSVKMTSAKEKELLNLQKEKATLKRFNESYERKIEDLDLNIVDALETVNKENFEREIKSLMKIKTTKGKAASIFKLKERVLGSRKTAPEPTVMHDPRTDTLVDSSQKIKKVSLQYCIDLLKTRPPKEGFDEIVERKRILHDERMQEKIEDDIDELSLEMFNEALKTVASKNGEKYKFLLRAGHSVINALFILFSEVWKTEKIPEGWMESLLVQLPKGNSDRSNLNNIRHIHLRNQTSKLFSQIVTQEARDNRQKSIKRLECDLFE